MLQLNYNKFSYFPSAGIEEADWQWLVQNGVYRRYTRGSFLCAQAQRITGLLCIVSGRTKSMHIFKNGNTRLNELLEAPAVFGHEALFAEGYDAFFPNVVALTPVEASFVPLETVEAEIAQRPALLLPLFKVVRNALSLLRIQSSWVLHLDLVQRTAYALSLTWNAPKDREGFVRITHEELGHYLGMSRANVTVSLNKLERMGLIQKRQGRIRLTDMAAIQALIGVTDWQESGGNPA